LSTPRHEPRFLLPEQTPASGLGDVTITPSADSTLSTTTTDDLPGTIQFKEEASKVNPKHFSTAKLISERDLAGDFLCEGIAN
jgi:hypothetical protein